MKLLQNLIIALIVTFDHHLNAYNRFGDEAVQKVNRGTNKLK